MPLLKGKFQPSQFTAVALASRIWGEDWEEMSDDAKQQALDRVQAALNALWREGIIE